jgi:hypothetical protein
LAITGKVAEGLTIALDLQSTLVSHLRGQGAQIVLILGITPVYDFSYSLAITGKVAEGLKTALNLQNTLSLTCVGKVRKSFLL